MLLVVSFSLSAALATSGVHTSFLPPTAEEFKTNREEFDRKAREKTIEFAVGGGAAEQAE